MNNYNLNPFQSNFRDRKSQSLKSLCFYIISSPSSQEQVTSLILWADKNRNPPLLGRKNNIR